MASTHPFLSWLFKKTSHFLARFRKHYNISAMFCFHQQEKPYLFFQPLLAATFLRPSVIELRSSVIELRNDFSTIAPMLWITKLFGNLVQVLFFAIR
jgi:hypothetical protein